MFIVISLLLIFYPKQININTDGACKRIWRLDHISLNIETNRRNGPLSLLKRMTGNYLKKSAILLGRFNIVTYDG
jgi:hypothetical protein